MIELSHVSKTYAPRLGAVARAIDDISLRVAPGEVAGIAGPAGAGKSTVVGLILGHVRPTTGSVLVDGLEPRRFAEREGVAYLPDRVTLPARWRVDDALHRLAVLSGVPSAATRARVAAAIDELGLGELRSARVRALSPDARKRLGIAQALIAERRVVVLDEPFDGLADDSRALFHDLVTRLRSPERAVLIASRDADEVRRLADRVTIIDRGRVRRVGAPRATTPADVETIFHLVMFQGAERVRDVFPSAISLGRSTFAVRARGLAELNRGLRELLDAGALLASVAPATPGAEQRASPVMTEVVS